MRRASKHQTQKVISAWILGKPASDSFLKAKWGTLELSAASTGLTCGFSITELTFPLCPCFLIAVPGVPSITWVSTVMKTGMGGRGVGWKPTFLNTHHVPGVLICIISFNPNPNSSG